MIATQNGSNWVLQDTGISAASATLALDSSGNPHIACIDGQLVKYASWTGNYWSIQTVDTVNLTYYPVELSLAIDQNNIPYNCILPLILDAKIGIVKLAIGTVHVHIQNVPYRLQ